VKKEC